MTEAGRDEGWVCQEHAAPSHISEAHKPGTEKNKKKEADLKTIKDKDQFRK